LHPPKARKKTTETSKRRLAVKALFSLASWLIFPEKQSERRGKTPF